MTNKFIAFILILTVYFLISFEAFSQSKAEKYNLLRSGFIYAKGSQNVFIKMDSDYLYEYSAYKFPFHFLWSKKDRHTWEFFVEPSYYRSKHQLYNYWFISHLVTNGDELRKKLMPLKNINEYVCNLGIMYRYYFKDNLSIYYLINVGPMYIDTETERLAKGFAFSDIFGLGLNYKFNSYSIDFKSNYRHVSNADTKMPNYGLNSLGLEVGVYYEFK